MGASDLDAPGQVGPETGHNSEEGRPSRTGESRQCRGPKQATRTELARNVEHQGAWIDRGTAIRFGRRPEGTDHLAEEMVVMSLAIRCFVRLEVDRRSSRFSIDHRIERDH